jgi:hypothetical protein
MSLSLEVQNDQQVHAATLPRPGIPAGVPKSHPGGRRLTGRLCFQYFKTSTIDLSDISSKSIGTLDTAL